MLDQRMRRLLEPALVALARPLSSTGVSPNGLTLFGAAAGIAAGAAVACDALLIGFVLAATSRLADGLDGPLARLRQGTDFGGYLDIVADFVFYTAIPLGFAVRDPQAALATAFLLAGYVFTGITFLAFSAVSERRGIVDAGDNRSFIFQPGLAEGTETLIVYFLMFLAPAWYAVLAWAYCAVCAYTALSRSVLAYRLFSPQ
jgi:phosphatidylglycerophosphate synthase